MSLHSCSPATEALRPGLDFRRPEFRREVFLRFYDFHTRLGTHPGLVYLLIPAWRRLLAWDDERTLWFAFLNANTQNPLTSLVIHRQFPLPTAGIALSRWYEAERHRLAFDTDRRYYRRALPDVAEAYCDMLRGTTQATYWGNAAAAGWPTLWAHLRALPTMGRLSAWSWGDYLSAAGLDVQPTTLLLEDKGGSRSHRNGLAIVSGHDEWDWHDSNPDFNGRYTPSMLGFLAEVGEELLAEARRRAGSAPYARHLSYLTLESALCTYKSWHRPRRRYPNVYADMHHDRIVAAQHAWPGEDFSVAWEARRALPATLRLEDNPGDPGVHPIKQDWYRLSGEVLMMDALDPTFANGFSDAARRCAWGRFR